MSDSNVRVDRRGAILEVRLSRPERKNALSLAMYTAICDALDSAAAEPEVRVVLITADGDAFCAGNDLQDFVQNPPTGPDSPVVRFLSTLPGFEKPIVAAVGGAAVGVGTTMLLHCDLVYASERAVFRMPFVNLALVPEAGSSFILPRMAGHARVGEALLLGERFDADLALALGILTRKVEHERLREVAMEKAEAMAALPPSAVRQTKALMRQGTHAAVEAAMRAEGAQFMARLGSEEFAEAASAFFMKRAPDFSRFS
ncbi:MAG: enoyl-CoA hydratase/isomerase family protein [Alphaproteobacteria bacterium]|nr:enoyl-CoA hydratase/isomerase family protein [Alphaproteobacteria bacterium]